MQFLWFFIWHHLPSQGFCILQIIGQVQYFVGHMYINASSKLCGVISALYGFVRWRQHAINSNYGFMSM